MAADMSMPGMHRKPHEGEACRPASPAPQALSCCTWPAAAASAQQHPLAAKAPGPMEPTQLHPTTEVWTLQLVPRYYVHVAWQTPTAASQLRKGFWHPTCTLHRSCEQAWLSPMSILACRGRMEHRAFNLLEQNMLHLEQNVSQCIGACATNSGAVRNAQHWDGARVL